jgi:hypothetical protein
MMQTLRKTLLVHGISTCLTPDEGVLVCTMHAFVTDRAVVLWARHTAFFREVRLFRSDSSLTSGACICILNALVDDGVRRRRRVRK